MYPTLKILVVWLSFIFAGTLAYLFLGHFQESPSMLMIHALMLLLGLFAFFIFLVDRVTRNKSIFLNFSIFFLIGAFQFVHLFVGHAFLKDEPFANFYSYQYYCLTLYPFAQLFVLLYVLVDSFFEGARTSRKYLLTFVISGGIIFYHNHSIFEDPDYLYKTAEIEDFRMIDRVVTRLANENESFDERKIASIVNLYAWKDGVIANALSAEDELKRVHEILPYISGKNYMLLIWNPLYLNLVWINLYCLVFVLLFLQHKFRRDPPEAAYLEKIVFLFFPLVSFEALHSFLYVKSIDHETFKHVAIVGHYATLANLIVLGMFIALRLHFITGVSGKFYERKMGQDATHVTRWRDGIDRMIVRHFFKKPYDKRPSTHR